MTKKPGKETLNCADKKYSLHLRLLDWQANPLNTSEQGLSDGGSRLEQFIVTPEAAGFKSQFVNFDEKGNAHVADLPPGPVTLRFVGSHAPLENAVANIPYNKAEQEKTPPRETDYRSRKKTAPEGSSEAEAVSADEGKWYHFHSYKDLTDGIQLLVDKENQAPLFQKIYESLPGAIKALIPFCTPHLIEVKQDLTPYMEVYVCDKYLKYKDEAKTQILDLNTYGHVALAVVVPGIRQCAYDFGRYSNEPYESLYPFNENFNYASWGILNVWDDPEMYLNDERSYKRRIVGFRFYLTKQQAQLIFDFFQAKINNSLSIEQNFNGVKTAYRLKDDYMALTSNCTTMSIDGMKATGIPDLIIGQYRFKATIGYTTGNNFAQFRGLYGKTWAAAATAYQYIPPTDGLFMPLDFEQMLLKNDQRKYDEIYQHGDESPETTAYYNSHPSYGGGK